MPIKVQGELPAKQILESENIFVMDESRALHQDIRPLKIAILNLMPIKPDTELQLLRALSNTPLQVDVTFMHMSSHVSKNTPANHLNRFYNTFEEVCQTKLDGMIITGAPVEQLEYEEVNYWDELKTVMEWTKENVTSTLHICWGAQAGLYYRYGIKKVLLDQKMFGVYPHRVLNRKIPIVRGFDDVFYAPHSRHTGIDEAAVYENEKLKVMADSEEAGIYLIMAEEGKNFFVLGHPEYDRLTLNNEYKRDLGKGLPIRLPKNYYPGDDPDQRPLLQWRAHCNHLYANWLNYYVYQNTPYEW